MLVFWGVELLGGEKGPNDLIDSGSNRLSVCLTSSRQASRRQIRDHGSISVREVNPLPSLMCLTSNSMLSHTHTLTHRKL